MQCLFEALQPVHFDGEIVTGVFEAEYSDVIEALVENGLIEPVMVEVPPVDTAVWELDHCQA